jgi:activator of 2-hydroxyglutaryl-CoA dehydratase
MAVQEALKQAGLKRKDLKAAVATGTLAVPVTAELNIAALKTRSPASCVARGAYFRFPEARTVLYVGADSSMAVRLSDDGLVEELGDLSLQSSSPEKVSSRCVVFAEGEILSFIHRNPPVPVPDVLAGANQCIADGLWGMVQKVGVPSELLLCGGVARNAGIVKAIEHRLGKPVLLPKQPQYVRALGAAVFARTMEKEGVATC